MASRRLVAFVAMLAVLISIAVLTQVAITPAPAQHGGNVKLTGKVTDKLIKHFEGSSGLAGVRAIELRRFTMAPGARMEGDMVFDHADLCIVEKGSITVTLPDGSKRVFKEGDIYIRPVGAKQKVVAADPHLGYDEIMWAIKVKGRH